MRFLTDAMRKEVEVGSFLHYTSLVTPSIVTLRDIGAHVFTMEMRGVAHTSADAGQINHWHHELSQLTLQLADPRVALHAHVVHDPVDDFPAGEFANGFARAYNAKYRALSSARRMHAARLFLSVVYQPRNKAERRLDRLAKLSEAALIEQQADDIAAVEDLQYTALAGLDSFGPGLLDCYEDEGVMYSNTLAFFGRLLTGFWRPVAVPRAEIRDVLPVVRPVFGKGGLLALKSATGIEYGAILAIKEYSTPTFPGRLDALLGERYPWVLSQSFAYLSDVVAKERMELHRKRLVAVGDMAKRQIKAIDDKIGDLVGGEIAMGEHDMALLVTAPDEKTLNNRIAAAGATLKMEWVREDISLGSAFFAMLPGHLGYRVSPGLVDNRNFSGLVAPHNYPSGRLDGAQWGPAVTLFQSEAGSPVAFNWHQPDPDPNAKFDPNHKEPATTLIIGPTGAGKTVQMGHLLVQTQKFGVFPPGFPGVPKLSCVVFDKDLGMAIVVPALGGKHYRIRFGLPSGLAPFQAEPTPEKLGFLDDLVTQLVTVPGLPALSLDQKKEITHAVAGVMATPMLLRRLGALLEFFDPHEPGGVHARLLPWCQGGRYGWLFDNAADDLDVDYPVVGFDVTDFLDRREICTPLMMYLLHRTDSLLDGRRVPIFIDEAPTLLADPLFGAYVERALVQIRKKDGFLVLGAQNARQILDSPLAAILVSQPATMIFLADDKADMHDLVRGFKLTVAEVEIIKKLGKRQALLRQGSTSTVIDLTLSGFEDEIAVLSGNTATSSLCGRLIEQYGPEPARWLPEFQRLRKGLVERKPDVHSLVKEMP